MSTPAFEDLKQGDFIKVAVGNERLWFSVLCHVDEPSNAIMCSLLSPPVTGVVFDGRVTIDRHWIVDIAPRTAKPTLTLVTAPP